MPQRKGLIAKIHIAKKQLALPDDCYQAVLLGVTGKESCKDMNVKELEKVLKKFISLGFSGKPKRAGQRKMARGPQQSKIRALWLALYERGAVENPSEEALAAYVKRMAGIDALQWITPTDADKVIKGLRGWIKRLEVQSENA